MVIGGGNSTDNITDLTIQTIDFSGRKERCRPIPDCPLGEIGVSAAFVGNEYILACGGGWTGWRERYGTNKCYALIVNPISL